MPEGCAISPMPGVPGFGVLTHQMTPHRASPPHAAARLSAARRRAPHLTSHLKGKHHAHLQS
ncbi:hypothetical protein KL86PLE_100263 [uncultured Pleomorphomonas sp.]|uniref:Uncharacterized protein n=1 Tax=uncultured Pleomorphomonas sp. TaxID=442121 RepID=A0A212L2H9_9HYPH|nr:hypothetical protein KL86PLE_100263 [uncultured Pleomorphomonas sp.]